MKKLTLLLALILTTSCLKKAEEEAKDDGGHKKKHHKSASDDETDDNEDEVEHHPLYGKWKFTPGVNGYQVFALDFVSVSSLPDLDECEDTPDSETVSLSYRFRDDETVDQITEYDDCQITIKDQEFEWDEDTGVFTIGTSDPIYLTKSGGKLHLKNSPVYGKWILRMNWGVGYPVDGLTYNYKFEKQTSATIPESKIRECGDPEMNGFSSESVYLYWYYMDETYSFITYTHDIDNDLYCKSAEELDGYTTDATHLTYLTAPGGSVMIIYDMILRNNNTEIYIR